MLPERFSPDALVAEVSSSGATIIHYLGVVAPMLLNQPPGPADRAHKVRFGIGAGIEPQLHEALRGALRLPHDRGVGHDRDRPHHGRQPRAAHDRARAPSAGRSRASRRAWWTTTTGTCPWAAEGELVVRHSAETPRHGFFSGYLKNEAATEEAWRGGWFHTGDVVRQDASGMLFFVDRKKHIIRRAGENIAAAEIEAVLQAHDAVAQVAVLAVARRAARGGGAGLHRADAGRRR